MTHLYQHILVGVDGSKESEAALYKAIHIALDNKAPLSICHVVDTRLLQSVTAFDDPVYSNLESEAKELVKGYATEARDKGVTEVKEIVEFGSPKNLLAHDLPTKEKADLIVLGATGNNAFERLLIGSCSQYLMHHAKVDLLIVRDHDK